MDISINNPVNLYTANTGNNLNLPVDNENKIYGANIFSSEFIAKENSKKITVPTKKHRKSKRLNTIDSDFLPDEIEENSKNENNSNFFVNNKINPYKEKIKNGVDYILTSIPLINYFYLKHKEKEIKRTVEELNNIMQNADELMNSAVPYGENGQVYQNIAQNLTNAANVIGKANNLNF